MTTSALTAESEALLDLLPDEYRVANPYAGERPITVTFDKPAFRERLAAIEAAASERRHRQDNEVFVAILEAADQRIDALEKELAHVRETGCEGLTVERLAVALAVSEVGHDGGCYSPFSRCEVDWRAKAAAILAALASPATEEVCAREGCGHEERHHRVDPDDIPWCWKDCPCPGYLAPSPATEEVERG